ncbi:hypothetical protein C2G38_2164739 [Gigaspora rosea]|uniref:VWFA domain-containing protein n=1 Tax=Gigaspora rosea TaxID=44941 RepID=A0A397VVF9_9GLOM|nr:hypothetical protein C2G38_2164739 [Gigaspora rosea]
MATDQDAVSLVLFNHSATVIFENRSLLHSEDLLEEMMKYFAEGSTDWINVNLVIVLSDGLDSLPENELRDFCENGNWVKYRHSMASVRFDHQNKIDKISLEIARDQAESYEKVLSERFDNDGFDDDGSDYEDEQTVQETNVLK